jgi:toxin YoeB
MTYAIEYSEDALESLRKYKKSNPAAYKKICKFIGEIHEHPREGTGHPKPLTNGDDVTYSRHINKKDRLIYDVYDDKVSVLVISAETHYSDK